MNKKIFYTVLAFACLASALCYSYYSYLQNYIYIGFDDNDASALDLKLVASTVENKTVILQDEDTNLTGNSAPSLFSPLTVAGLGLSLVASVPIALKILNHHSKKIEAKQKK
jgi:hypothetical protein